MTPALARKLAAWDRSQRQEQRACELAYRESRNDRAAIGLYDIQYKVLLDTPEVFGVLMAGDVYCGGAHPETIYAGLTFPTRSGTLLNPVRALDLGIQSAHKDILKATLLGPVRELLLQRNRGPDGTPDCIDLLESLTPESVGPAAVVPGRDGLHVAVKSSRVVASCFGEVTVPYQRLQLSLGTVIQRLSGNRD